MASNLTKWINNQLKMKDISAKEAKKDAGKYKSIAAAKKAGSLYYTDKNGKVKVASYAEDVQTMKTPPARPKSKDSTIKVTVLTPILGQTPETLASAVRAKGKGPEPKVSRKGPAFEEKGRGTPPTRKSEKRDPSKVVQSLKGVSNAKIASRIRGKLKEEIIGGSSTKSRYQRELTTIMNKFKGDNRGQKMLLDSLLKRIDMRVKKKMAMGGMMDKKKINPTTGMSMSMGGLSGRKVNPSTGLSMKKGGMVDYRKTGMMYGGGMARKR